MQGAATALARLVAVRLAERVPGGPPPGIHDPALLVDRAVLLRECARHGVDLRLHGIRPSVVDLWHDLREVTREVRPDWDLSTPGLREAWDAGDYTAFLTRGASMPPAERDRILTRLADLIGLPAELVVRAEGRVTIRVFTRELLRDERDSTNHACRSELWFGTQSISTLRPRPWASATRVSKSSNVPNSGSTSQ